MYDDQLLQLEHCLISAARKILTPNDIVISKENINICMLIVDLKDRKGKDYNCNTLHDSDGLQIL